MSFHFDLHAAELAERVGNYPGDHLLTTEELAAWLALSPPCVKRMRAEGLGPKVAALCEQRLRYCKSDALQWLEERARTGWRHDRLAWVEHGSRKTSETRLLCARAPASEGARSCGTLMFG